MAIVVIVIQTAMENPTAGIGAVPVPAKATVLVAAVRAMGVTGNLTAVKDRVTRGAKELSIAEAKVGAGVLESPTAKTSI
jgi:uncharacterized protein YunC (DUF1805 family)